MGWEGEGHVRSHGVAPWVPSNGEDALGVADEIVLAMEKMLIRQERRPLHRGQRLHESGWEGGGLRTRRGGWAEGSKQSGRPNDMENW